MSDPLLNDVAALVAAGRRAEALQACALLAEEHPGNAEIANMHAFTLLQSGDAKGAVREARRAVEIAPHMANLHVNLARALMHNEELAHSLEALDRARALAPQWVEPCISAAEVCIQQGRLFEAAERCRAAIAQFPNEAELVWTLANALHFSGRNEEAVEALSPAAARNPTDLRLVSAMAHFSNYIAGWTPEQVLEAHKRYGKAIARHFAVGRLAAPAVEPLAGRRMRVGIISPDLREHSVSFFVKPLLEHYDRETIELFAYHTSATSDGTTSSLSKLAEHWRLLPTRNADEAAKALRGDRLDVLIDLAGHTKGHSLFVMSRGVAAKTATYLGYPNTTGLGSIGHRLVDSYTDPAGAEALAVEKLVRLDPCFLCFSPPESAPEVGPSPSEVKGCVTFGSFNTLKKINDATISLWAGALKRVDGSRLMLKCHGLEEPAAQANLWERFGARGVVRERVEFMGPIKATAGHLAAYDGIDVALDTYPYHGTTTTCEALWMGVPVVTLAGKAHASRVGVSLLTNVGLAGLIAADAGEFASIAARIAADEPRRAQLRRELRGMVQGSPLCDGRGFARRFEAAVRQMVSG